MTPQPATPVTPNAAGHRWLSVLLGLLLLLPAAVCCGSTLVAPSVQTLVLSLQAANGLGPGRFVGLENYTHVATLPTISRAAIFTLEIITVRVLAAAIVPLLLALAASALNRWVRGGLRLLFTLPLALFAPTALVVAWLVSRTLGNNSLSSPAGAQGTILFLDGAQTLGLACGAGLIAYLAALRMPADGAARRGGLRSPVLLVWIVSTLAAVASGLQSFVFPYLLTRGGPASATTPLALAQFNLAFINLQLGSGAAVAMLSLAPLLVLGLVAGLLLAASGVRLQSLGPDQPPASAGPVLAAAAVVVVLGLAAFIVWISGQATIFQTAALALRSQPAEAGPAGTLAADLAGPLSVLLVQLPLAYLGALGISGLRPLGRRSEWLLLPFSPWLFVTLGPLSIAAYTNLRQMGQVNTTFGLASPILVSLPMLFVLALFFRGRQSRWRSARAAGGSALTALLREFILPSIPLALLLAIVGMLASSQELLWPLLAANKPEFFTSNMALATQLARAAGRTAPLARAVLAVVLPGFALSLLGLGLLQVLYVGRLALSTGPEDGPGAGS